MIKKISVVIFALIMGLILSSCNILFDQQDADLESTRIALAVQQTQLAIEQGQAAQTQPQQEQPQEQPPQPSPTVELVPSDTSLPQPTPTQEQPTPTQEQPTPEPVQVEQPTEEPTQEGLFGEVEAKPEEFFCSPADGPTQLTITVDMTDINRGGALFWRLHEKATDTKLGWELVDMGRYDSDTRTYTFDADMAGGTDNFYYPGGMGESWFEFQIISNDGAERTEVFADVTFHPCP